MAKTVDGRVGKIPKKNKERKVSVTDLERGLKYEDNNDSPLKSPSVEIKDEKKPSLSGVVINGKTWACATCKAGHRVGVCKHASERPMKATHPPGRPAAGAPKKIVCDCPRECSCSKKDCKCPRNCKCTQVMFMLVYIPEPGKEDEAAEEYGTWMIDKEVVTDLKGNILSPEQVEERKQQKEAIRAEHNTTRSRSESTTTAPQPISPSTAKPTAEGGCCKHKQKIVEQQKQQQEIAAETKQPATNVGQIEGCNCGVICKCEFCPQHPNNSTSRNLAMQQVKNFQNQQMNFGPDNISFLPDMPHNASCMGGQPRFAMSTNPYRPSFAQLQQTFPSAGYVIAYPVWSMRNQFVPHIQPTYTNLASAFDNTGMNVLPDTVPSITSDAFGSGYDLSDSNFNIGNAFVASAGPSGWEGDTLSPDGWPIPTSSEFSTQDYDFSALSSVEPDHNIVNSVEDGYNQTTLSPSILSNSKHIQRPHHPQFDGIQHPMLSTDSVDLHGEAYNSILSPMELPSSISPLYTLLQYPNRI